ncbi:MAG TPA: glycerol-3-phosphate 1-O-acyltransferase PlsY [Xenococcaceae cyanobacterium]|jgi:glycerol-3-phosphate acyltransferase PlsY
MLVSLTISVLLVGVAYLLGATPTGYLAGKYLQGIDIREYGSGSTGATNVLRTLGKLPAIAVLTLDVAKGALAILLVKGFYRYDISALLPLSWQFWLITAVALSAILGHSKSIWLNFTGGKSVSTSLGVLLMMSPLLALGTLITFVLTLAISRIVSLSSIMGAVAVTICAILLQLPLPYIIFAALAGSYVILRHSNNIQRLLEGEEPKIGQKLQENG